jgi:hypothetical protein
MLVPPVSNLFEFQHFIVTSTECEARRLVILSILLLTVPSQVVNRRFPAEEARGSGTRCVWSWWWRSGNGAVYSLSTLFLPHKLSFYHCPVLYLKVLSGRSGPLEAAVNFTPIAATNLLVLTVPLFQYSPHHHLPSAASLCSSLRVRGQVLRSCKNR